MGTEPVGPTTPALFDVDRLAHTAGDSRSVGEILWDADRGARELLGRVDGEDAGGLLHGWPGVVEAAANVWAALPDPDPLVRRQDGNCMDQLEAAAASVSPRLRRDQNTEVGRDARMVQIAADLAHAARLVERFGGRAATERSAVRRDIAAARMRTMHTVYVATHAVVVALRAPREASPSRDDPGRWSRRLSACERLAGGYIGGRISHAFGGEAQPAGHDPDRLQQALTRWDLQVHRGLARASSATNLEAVALTEAGIAATGQVLVAAARRGDLLASDLPAERLEQAMGRTAGAWRDLASRWADLRTPTTPPDRDLAHAAAEVRATFRELVHDGTTMAPVEVIAERPGTGPAAAALVAAIATSHERAQVVADHADNPHLTGPARSLSLRAEGDMAAGLADPPADENSAWVSPADITAGRTVPLPRPVADGLRAASKRVEGATSEAGAVAGVAPSGPPPTVDVRHSAVTASLRVLPPATSRRVCDGPRP